MHTLREITLINAYFIKVHHNRAIRVITVICLIYIRWLKNMAPISEKPCHCNKYADNYLTHPSLTYFSVCILIYLRLTIE